MPPCASEDDVLHSKCGSNVYTFIKDIQHLEQESISRRTRPAWPGPEAPRRPRFPLHMFAILFYISCTTFRPYTACLSAFTSKLTSGSTKQNDGVPNLLLSVDLKSNISFGWIHFNQNRDSISKVGRLLSKCSILAHEAHTSERMKWDQDNGVFRFLVDFLKSRYLQFKELSSDIIIYFD